MRTRLIIGLLLISLFSFGQRLKKEYAPVRFYDSVTFMGKIYPEYLPDIDADYVLGIKDGATGKISTTSQFVINAIYVDTLHSIDSAIYIIGKITTERINADTISLKKANIIANSSGIMVKCINYPFTNKNTTRFYIISKEIPLTSGVSTTVFKYQILGGEYIGGQVKYAIVAVTPSTDIQILSGQLQYAGVNKSGTPVAAISEIGTETTAKTAGTLTDIWSATVSPNTIEFKVNATSSLTPLSQLYISFQVFQQTPGSLILP